MVLTIADVIASRWFSANLNINRIIFQVDGSMGTARWLGRKVRFYDPHELELSSRIASALETFLMLAEGFDWEIA